MMAFIPPRLRKPAGIAVAGVLFGAAWLVRGGPLWWISILAADRDGRPRDPPVPAGRAGHRRGRAGRVSGGRAAATASACGHGPWPATWPRSPHSSA